MKLLLIAALCLTTWQGYDTPTGKVWYGPGGQRVEEHSTQSGRVLYGQQGSQTTCTKTQTGEVCHGQLPSPSVPQGPSQLRISK